MKSQKNLFTKTIKAIAEKAIIRDANSTSCIIYHQPKAPANLKKFSKIDK